MRIDEKFGTKEKNMDYNFDEDNYSGITNRCSELFIKTSNELHSSVQTEEVREEQNAVPEIRVEATTPTPNKNLIRNHLANKIIGGKEKGVMTRRKINEELCLISQVEPKTTYEAIKDDHWIKAMEEELQQIIKNDTWELVSRSKDKNVIDTEWVFRNKMNEQGKVIRNKVGLVCKGYF